MLEKSIKIPDGVGVTLEGNTVRVQGPKGVISRELTYPGIEISLENNTIKLRADKERRTQKALVGTFSSHINNMIKGVTQGFEYKMRAVYSHFPMSIKVSGDEIIVENFLGEKTPRKTKIVGDTSVKVKGKEIIITGCNIEDVGQTAANIEQLTKVKNRDRRVFQDGIYIVEKNGVPI
jgi:large subunit ribosomal protein L6